MDFRTKSRLSKVFASLESEGESVSTTEVGGNENGAVKVEEIRVERELALDLASMEQDITVLDQDEGTAEELATATEEIVRLGDAVESFAAEGGLNKQGAQFLNLALESITHRIGLEFNVPAVESFGGSFGDRVAMTASLEAGISESLKKTWEALKKFIREQIGKLKEFVKRLFDSRTKLKNAIKVKTESLKLAESADKKFKAKVIKDADQMKVIEDSVKLVKGTHEGMLAYAAICNDAAKDPSKYDAESFNRKAGDACVSHIKGLLSQKSDTEYETAVKTLFGTLTISVPTVNENGNSETNYTAVFAKDEEIEEKEFSGAQITGLFKAAEKYCSDVNTEAMLKSVSEAVEKGISDESSAQKGIGRQYARMISNASFVKMDARNMKALNKMVSSVSGPVSTGVAVAK